MAEIGDLVPIDDNNTARWPEGMAPSGVNDAGRADEGIMSRWHRDTNGSLTSAGTGSAYTLTTNQSLTAYYDGLEITFVAHAANSASPTLQLGALSAAEIQTSEGNSLAAGDIPSGSVVNVISQDNATTPTWRLMNVPGGSNVGLLDADNTWTGSNTFTQDMLIDKASGVVSFRMRTTASSGFPHETYYTAHNASAADIDYANLSVQIIDNTAASEDGEFIINTAQAGTTRPAFKAQAGIMIPDGNTDPTSGDLGSGWINAREGVARQGVEYTRGWSRSAENTTTGVVSLDFTGLPTGLNEIIFMSKLISLSSTSNIGLRIGTSSGFESTGYIGSTTRSGSLDTAWSTDALLTANPGVASASFRSIVRLTKYEGNTWWIDGSYPYRTQITPMILSGYKTLAGDLDRLQVRAGSGNIDVNDGSLVLYR